MASLSTLRTGLKQTIKNGVAATLYTYDTVADLANVPAALIEPSVADYMGAFGRGTHTWLFNVFVVCSRRDEKQGQRELDAFISGSGPNSIVRALYDRPDLGLDDSVDATVARMAGYGGHFESAKIPLVGAILQVRVITDGRV